ncbi:MAG: hypothetical protein N3D20_01425 [Candidatus Pacearchaeota archaeon]|nr:hypothetical protein [Candidatus Pacearchaeota archaeon]
MNKRASVGDVLMDNVVYLIILMIFILGMFGVVWKQSNSAVFWEDYYAKEIAKIVDLAKPGDVVVLDVHKLMKTAKANGFLKPSEIFWFDNLNNKICVKLSPRGRSCYSYFNDVRVVGQRIEVDYSIPRNLLKFNITGSENA